jgi:hypothetical protein
MDDKNEDMDDAGTSEWKQKKEALLRLANALENTSPPRMHETSVSSHSSEQQVKNTLLQKLKTLLTRIFNTRENHYTTL